MMFAKRCGLHSFLVLSGVVQRDALEHYKKSPRDVSVNIKDNLPDFVANRLGQLGDFIRNVKL